MLSCVEYSLGAWLGLVQHGVGGPPSTIADSMMAPARRFREFRVRSDRTGPLIPLTRR